MTLFPGPRLSCELKHLDFRFGQNTGASSESDFFSQTDLELGTFAISSNRQVSSAHLETLRTLQQGVHEGTPKATETVLEGVSH